MGATNKPGWMEKAPETASENPGASWAVSVVAAPPNPTTRNTTNAMPMLGPVVYAMYRMWVMRSVPATAGARLVVSLSGDILSPKYAPLMMAPATQPSDNPSACPMPTKAMPTVPTVPQELPVANERTAHTKHAANRKMPG